MKHIDITMTAVIRPKVLEMTLESFCTNLFIDKDIYRLIINIDPVGDENKTQDDILNICNKYFDRVIYNCPNKPSFPKAVIWTWSQTTSDFIFHLEDDWKLNRKMSMKQLVKILHKNPHLACVRLYKHDIPNKRRVRLFNSPYVYNEQGHFFEALDCKKQFGLNPVLIRSEFIKESLPLIVDDKNPEKQFRYGNKKMRDIVMKWKYAIFGDPGDKILVWGKNGLHWRENSKYEKPNDGSQFITWKETK